MLADKTEPVSYIFGINPENSYCEVYMADMTQAEKHYALDYCFEKMGIVPQTVDKEEIGSLDMKIVVRSREDGRWLAEQYFVCDDDNKTFEVHKAE